MISFVRRHLIWFCWGILCLARLPSLFDPIWYGDEAIYLAVAQGIARGQLLYVQVWDNKPPLLYLVYTFSNLIFGGVLWPLRVIGVILAGLTIRYSQLFASRVLQFNSRYVDLVTVLVTILFSFGLETTIFNAENLFAPLLVIGTYYVFTGPKLFRLFIGSLVWGMAILTKIPTVAEILGLWLVFVLTSIAEIPSSEERVLENFIKKTQIYFGHFGNMLRNLIILAGVVLPLGLTSIFYWVRGHWGEFYFAVVGFAGDYIGDSKLPPVVFGIPLKTPGGFGGVLPDIGFSQLQWKVVFFGILVVALAILFVRQKISRSTFLVSVWVALAAFGSLISGRNYPHYLIQVFVPFALFTAVIIGKYRSLNTVSTNNSSFQFRTALIISYLLIINQFTITFASGLMIPPYFSPTKYWWDFGRVITNQMTLANWQRDYNPDSYDTQKELIPIIQSLTGQDDRILIIGNWAELYVGSKRLSSYYIPVEYNWTDQSSQVWDKAKDQTKLAIIDTKSGKAKEIRPSIAGDMKYQRTVLNRYEIWLKK